MTSTASPLTSKERVDAAYKATLDLAREFNMHNYGNLNYPEPDEFNYHHLHNLYVKYFVKEEHDVEKLNRLLGFAQAVVLWRVPEVTLSDLRFLNRSYFQ